LSKHNATFHHWGIGTPQEADLATAEAAAHNNITGTAALVKRREPRMKTLQQTIIELNHSHQTIDIFKIDCESCEWFQYTTWLHAMRAENVTIRQILVETHHILPQHDNDNDATKADAHNFFMTLHDAGYVIFSKEVNYEAQASCVEFAFIKLSLDFFINDTLYKNHQYQ
jgi:Methyltransferase domain